MNKTVAIIGSGAWGTAVATILTKNEYTVKLWCYESEVANDIKNFQINKRYLPGIALDKKIQPTTSIQEALTDVQIIFEATPIKFLRPVLKLAQPYVTKGQSWVILSKGIENKTLFLPTEIIGNVLGYEPRIAIMSGPNFAKEVAKTYYSATIISSKDSLLQKELGNMLTNNYFKPYFSTDTIGVQVGGALKNVISIFLGIMKGAGFKENTRAFLFTKGLGEINTIAKFLGAEEKTMYGLSGLGDMILSSLGDGGRNCKIGTILGQGNSLQDLSKIMYVLPEGINTIESLYEIIQKHNLQAPICSATYKILFEGQSIRGFFRKLMEEPPCHEK